MAELFSSKLNNLLKQKIRVEIRKKKRICKFSRICKNHHKLLFWHFNMFQEFLSPGWFGNKEMEMQKAEKFFEIDKMSIFVLQ